MSGAHEAIEKAMRDNPTGMIVSIGKKNCSAVFWHNVETDRTIMVGNFLSGFAQQAIDRGVLTKRQAIQALEATLKDRK